MSLSTVNYNGNEPEPEYKPEPEYSDYYNGNEGYNKRWEGTWTEKRQWKSETEENWSSYW